MGQIISINATTVLDYVESVLNISLINSISHSNNEFLLRLCARPLLVGDGESEMNKLYGMQCKETDK